MHGQTKRWGPGNRRGHVRCHRGARPGGPDRAAARRTDRPHLQATPSPEAGDTERRRQSPRLVDPGDPGQSGAGGAPQQVAAAVESCMAAIELIEDLRYDYKRLDAAAMGAGNVWNAGVVLGTPMTDWAALDRARLTARSRSTDAKSARASGAM